MSESNYWSKSNKEIARKICQKTNALSYIHEHAAGSFSKKDANMRKWINIFNLIFGSSGIIIPITVIIASLEMDEKVYSIIMNFITIAVSVAVFVLGVIGTYFQAKDLSGLSTRHARASDAYIDLYLHANTMRRRSKEVRQDFLDFFNDMYRRDSQIRAEAGDIPEKSILSYYETFGEKALDRDILFNKPLDEMDEINNSPIKSKIKKYIERTNDELFQLQRYRNSAPFNV